MSPGDLDKAVADGRLSEHDANEVRRFAELLRELRPAGDQPRTFAELVAMAKYHDDGSPENADFFNKLLEALNRRVEQRQRALRIHDLRAIRLYLPHADWLKPLDSDTAEERWAIAYLLADQAGDGG